MSKPRNLGRPRGYVGSFGMGSPSASRPHEWYREPALLTEAHRWPDSIASLLPSKTRAEFVEQITHAIEEAAEDPDAAGARIRAVLEDELADA